MSNESVPRHAIAIIGMAGRFPGAKDIDELWANLQAGVESIVSFSDDEALASGVSATMLRAPNYVKAAGVLDDIELFDASFFRYSPREAELIDPQHRLFLMAAWEALEHAGYDPARFPGRIGVYAGTSMSTYALFTLYAQSGAINSLDTVLGNDKDHLTTRASYKLNLKGPSVNVNTACSTSLVAVHLACQNLLNGECDMALAGGVTVQVPQKAGYLYEEGSILSPDGHCRAFDAEAHGCVGSSGLGIVVLKRLEDALADGDHIHAVIRGSAINNDGAVKVGYTAPSVEGQAEVIADALAMAEVSPETVTYVETHGTGTELGDPIEVAALTNAYRAYTQATGYCALGSIKSNLGHLNAAAGAAGLIKAVLSLEHQQLFPSLHFHQPNPQIDFAHSPFFVNATLCPWTAGATPRRAGVSSFGLGGTNAHIVLEEAPARDTPSSSRPWQLLALSARTPKALKHAADNLTAYLRSHPEQSLADVAYTLQVGRHTFDHRLTVVCQTTDEASAALEAVAPHAATAASKATSQPSVAFLFPGQGTQFIRMAVDVYQHEPVFREQVDRCARLLKPHLGLDLREVLYPADAQAAEASRLLDQTAMTQPALFVVEYALACLWIDWGIQPQALLGHSIGEYVAACLAGVFSLEEALALVVARGRLMQSLPSGSMLAVSLSQEEVQPLLTEELSLAAINAPQLCVLAGSSEAIERLERTLAERGVHCRLLHTSHAFHSSMMDAILDAFTQQVRRVTLKAPQLPFISNVTGTWITAEEATDPTYWAKHLRQAVHFAEGIQTLLEDPARVLLEVGPGQTLAALAQQQVSRDAQHVIVSSMPHAHAQETQSAAGTLLTALGRLWAAGIQPDWSHYYARERRHRIPLPTYPFELQRYWLDAGPRPGEVAVRAADPHKLSDIADWFYVPSWRRTSPPRLRRGERLPESPSCWLIFSTDSELSTEIVRELRSAGHEVITVAAATRFERRDTLSFTLRPSSAQDYRTLLTSLRDAGKTPAHILHLWSLSDRLDGASGASTRSAFASAQDTGFYSLLYLAQELVRMPGTTPIQLTVISNGLHDVTGDEQLLPEKAPLLAPCKVLPQEYPHISCRYIDIVLAEASGRRKERMVKLLLAELAATSPDTAVAYRAGQRWSQDYDPVRLERAEQDAAPLRTGGTYVITGGLGSIGMALAEHLAEVARANLVLIGRSPFPDRAAWDSWLSSHDEQDPITLKIRQLQAMERRGAHIETCSADVADRRQMKAILDRTLRRFGALHGVIHAAGLTREHAFRVLPETTRIDCESHFRPKVLGLLVLDEILADHELDFCLLMSSSSSVLGGLGVTAYSAANLFLDAYARYRHQSGGRRWISINWDRWRFGPAQAELYGGFGASIEELAIVPSEGVDAFDRLITLDTLDSLSQVVVSSGDLQPRLQRWTRITTSPREPEEASPEQRHASMRYPRPSLPMAYVAARNDIEERIVAIWQDTLGIEPVGIHDNFLELGGHSLMATQLLARLRAAFHVELSLPVLFAAPTIAALAENIATSVRESQTREDQLLSALQPMPRTMPIPLSFPQERLWFLDQMEPGAPTYNIPIVMRVRGALDVVALGRSLDEMLRRHESLRTMFVAVDGMPAQVVAPSLHVDMPVADLTALDGTEREAEALRRATAEARVPFDLSAGPLFRVRLLRLAADEHVLIMTMHHIVSDGWSTAIFNRELAALYAAYARNMPSPLPDLPIQYPDYAIWQRNGLQGEAMERLLSFWRQQLSGAPSVLAMPTDHPRPAVQSFQGASHPVHIPADLAMSLQALSRQEGVTLFMTLLAAFQALLHRYTGQDDLVIGTPIAGRTRPETEGLIGYFANTLALRTQLAGDPTFRELLARVRDVALSAYAHQELSFERLVKELHPDRDLSHNPLFQVLFVLQNAPTQALELAGLTLTPIEIERGSARFDVAFELYEEPDGLVGAMEYNIELFEPATIARLDTHFQTLLAGVLHNPDTRLSDIPLLTEDERQRMVIGWNETSAASEDATCLHQLVEVQAVHRPHAVAAVFEGASLTYHELDVRANQLAHYLRAHGVGPEVLVGLCVERSLDLLVGVLGILKSGGAYVPLDPTYPRERLAFLLNDARISVLVSQEHLRAELPSHDAEVICLDTAWSAIAREDTHAPASGVRGENLAYVLYTSGSTGRPKGVQIPHAAVVNFLASMRRQPGLSENDVVLAVTSLSFDIAGLELFLPLMVGARVEIVSREVGADGVRLADRLAQSGATLLQATPATWRLLLVAGWAGSQRLKLLCGGEALPRELADQLLACGASLWNLYGPTETTIWSAAHLVQAGDASVPIGRPIANTQIYVLNAHLQPVPIGVPGEVYIGGHGLARGYLRRPDLTAERFVPHPFSHTPGARLYRTGDLARYLPDGSLMFLGRIDHQVKIRGYRIELGEIEATLEDLPDVRQAVARTWTDPSGEQRLVAYVVPTTHPAPAAQQLRAALQAHLPDYMIPSAFIPLETLPLTPNGKVDRRALPAPDLSDAALGIAYVGPRTPTEEVLAPIWASVLGIERVGIRDNFFELGGHSLLAIQLVARMRDTFGVEIPLRTLFEYPTVAEVAAIIARRQATASSADEALEPMPGLTSAPAQRYEPFPLTDVQEAYWVGRASGLELGNIATHGYVELDSRDLDISRLERAWQRVVARHDMLRAIVQPDGQQRILADVAPYAIAVSDLRAAPPNDVTAMLAAIRERLSHQVFHPEQWPLFEICASLLPDGRTRLHFSADILMADAWSWRIINTELDLFYADPDRELPPLELSFRDYVLAERALRDTRRYNDSLEYWRRRLPELPPAPNLPLARTPGEVHQPHFRRRSGRLEPVQWEQLKRMATRAGLTPSVVLLAAYAEVLGVWSKNPEFTINLTLFNRIPLHPQVADIVGDFTSLTLLAVDQRTPAPFIARARQVQAQLWEDLEHRYVSGVTVLRELARLQKDLGRAAMPVVFTSALTLQKAQDSSAAPQASAAGAAAWHAERGYSITQTSQVWLDQQVGEQDGALVFNWDAVEDLFPEGLLDDLFEAYGGLIHRLAGDEAVWNESLNTQLVPAAQRQRRASRNATDAPISEALLHTLVAEQVAKRAQQPAVISASDTLSYGELANRAARIAHWLTQHGAQPNQLVAVVMEKGWEQVAAVLGILRSGAAYLPIDPESPSDRLHYLLEHSQARLVLTQPWLDTALAWPESVTRLAVDQHAGGARSVPAFDARPVQQPDDLAYVIYTSGSTGHPKGVMIDHRGAVNTILDINDRFGVGPQDRVLALSALTFDLSVYDIFGTLAAGGTIILPDAQARRDPAHWAELLEREHVTIWNSVPALMDLLIEYLHGHRRPELPPVNGGHANTLVRRSASPLLGELRLVLLSGDWIPVQLPDQIYALRDDVQVASLGGATEASIWSILYPIEREKAYAQSIPYGHPMRNQRFHVLNAALEPCPDWVPGELYIGGIGLAKGYWRDSAKTQASFITHPRTHERLYRTGDLGRYRPDGEIEFLGREDFQVKVQGFRIELGEIEATLLQHPGVHTSVVTAIGQALESDKRLVAYVVRALGAANLDATDLRAYLSSRLPEYMVPSAVVFLDALPLSANGKVDRKALPAPTLALAQAAHPQQQEGGERPPDTGLAAQIATLVAQVLKVDSVPVDADLLGMGANSVDMVRIANRLEERFQIRPSIADLFRAATVAAITRFYEQYLQQAETASEAIQPRRQAQSAQAAPALTLLRDPADRERFKSAHLGIRRDLAGADEVRLPMSAQDEAALGQQIRRTSGLRIAGGRLAFEQLSELLSCLRQIPLDGKLKYRWGSAGGLYPIQTYLYVKPEMVEGVGPGTYYYHPVANRLVPITPGASVGRESYSWVNQAMFDQAAFALFLIGELAAINPMYGELSQNFCLIEAGLMTQLLEMSAPDCAIGLCQVGEVAFDALRPLFALHESHVYLHSLLGGAQAPALATTPPAQPRGVSVMAANDDWEEGEL